MMNNIAIIGVGALGKRHLQSMIELQNEYNIYAVEANEDMLAHLKTEFQSVAFSKSINELPVDLGFVVIATNSNVRRSVFEQLISHSNVKNILFEKVLFQKDEDYYYVQGKLKELNIKAWVNCARREWNAYKRLKEELGEASEMHFIASGGEWGIGCNGIHMLDLVEYLSNDTVSNISVSELENGLYESKRKGYYEFYGHITGNAGKCRGFDLICMKDSKLPFSIEIVTDKKRYIIEEYKNRCLISNGNDGWKEIEFNQTYQSQMTARVIKDVIDRNDCDLTKYDSSMNLHLKYINALMTFFNKNGWEEKSCPIT